MIKFLFVDYLTNVMSVITMQLQQLTILCHGLYSKHRYIQNTGLICYVYFSTNLLKGLDNKEYHI